MTRRVRLTSRARSALRDFLSEEASGGIILMAAAAAALAVANSPLSATYFHALHVKVAGLSIQHWINDALMAVFFLLVGLEIKRELLDGELSSWSRRVLPGVAAAGGMIVPALIYVAVNAASPATLRGWAIPAATDIAFALGVLSLLGPRVPVSLKIFLTALAILDDLGAVVIIAVFYTSDLSLPFPVAAASAIAALIALGALRVKSLVPYLVIGAALWWFTLQSGVHATLAGVALALTIPLKRSPAAPEASTSLLHRLEHAPGPWVAYLIVPVFGFANAGVALAGVTPQALLAPVPLGVALGLFLGKQVGVFGASWALIKLGFADLPANASWRQLYGVAVLCGVGFTMSLFIGMLAFDTAALQDETKIGVLVGSVASALVGWVLLRIAPRAASVYGKRLGVVGALVSGVEECDTLRMTKTFTCRELGGVCDHRFSGDSVMSIMQQAMPHMQSDDAHKEHVANLSKTTGESREAWMARMQREFDAKPEVS